MADEIDEIPFLYDLSRDLVLNDDSRTLQMSTIFNIILKLFTPERIMQHVNNIYPGITAQHPGLMTAGLAVWEEIEPTIVEEAKTLFRTNRLDLKIAEATHFIGRQIYLFLSKNRYPNDILVRILNKLELTWHGTINLNATFLKVLRIRALDYKSKFEIACRNFMGEKVIMRCFKRLSRSVIRSYVRDRTVTDERIPIYFFVCRFTGVTKEIQRAHFRYPDAYTLVVYFSNVNSSLTIEFLFYWAVFTFNDKAFHYLWDNYISVIEDRDIIVSSLIPLVNGDFRMANLFIYLLTNISDDEILLCIQERRDVIFNYLLLHLRWQSSFIKIIKAIESGFENITHTALLKHMIGVWCSDEREKFGMSVIREFIKIIPEYEKYMLLNIYSFFMFQLLQNLFIKRDLEACTILMEIGEPSDADRLFMTDNGMILFEMMVYLNELKFIDDLLLSTMSSYESTVQFKKSFFDRKAHKIYSHFISNGRLEYISFTEWCQNVIPEEEIISLKSDILYFKKGNVTKKFLFHNPENIDLNFQYVESVLEWCFDSENDVDHFKRFLILTENRDENSGNNTINLYTEIRECAANSNFSFLTHFFQWKNCLSFDLRNFKRSLLYDEEFFRVIFLEKNILDFVPNFLEWFDGSIPDRELFKRKFLHQDRLFEEKVNRNEFSLVRDLVEILNPSETELQRFKEKLYRLTKERLSSISPITDGLADFLSWIKSPT